MFDVIETTLSAEVAASGTFTVSYPDNRSAGDYEGSHDHFMSALQTTYTAPEDFTLTFGASEITVTWGAGNTTLPASSPVKLQVDRGAASEPEKVILPDRMFRVPVIRIDLGSPDDADADGVCASQSITSAAGGTINGVLASNGVATFDVPRNVVGAWTTSAVLTVTGTDEFGNVVVESSASGTSFTGKKAFKTVTGIAVSANVTLATIGTGDVLGLPVFLPRTSDIVGELEDGVEVGAPHLISLNAVSPSLADAGQVYVTSPVKGNVKAVYVVTNTVIDTADSTLSVKTAAGTVGAITIALSGTAVGVVDSLTTGLVNTEVAAGGTIEIENDAAPGAGLASYTVLIEPSAGVITAGVASKATATTGDVRGTFAPSTEPDGSTAYSLLMICPDPGNRGVDQYAG